MSGDGLLQARFIFCERIEAEIAPRPGGDDKDDDGEENEQRRCAFQDPGHARFSHLGPALPQRRG